MNIVQSTLILGTLAFGYGPMSSHGVITPQESSHATQTQEMDLRDAVKLSRISLLDAMKAAAKAQSGTIVEAGLEGEIKGKNRAVFFEIMILDQSDTLHEIRINPSSGSVMKNGTEDDQEEVKGFRSVVRNSEISLMQLIEKASSIIRGHPVSAALQMEEEGPECEIVYTNTRYLIKASLETRAGHLVDLELKKDGESKKHSCKEGHEEGDHRSGSQEDEDGEGGERDERKGEEEGEHNERGRTRK